MTPLAFRLPDVGEGTDAADILEWRVAEGEHVREDQDLVEIQTDKAIATYEAEEAGVLHIVAAVGDTVPLGGVIAELR